MKINHFSNNFLGKIPLYSKFQFSLMIILENNFFEEKKFYLFQTLTFLLLEDKIYKNFS